MSECRSDALTRAHAHTGHITKEHTKYTYIHITKEHTNTHTYKHTHMDISPRNTQIHTHTYMHTYMTDKDMSKEERFQAFNLKSIKDLQVNL
jgi:hypothetical protein